MDLGSALLGKRVPTIHDRVYRDYSLTPTVMRSSDLARRGRGRKMISTAQGEVYDLDRMFAKVESPLLRRRDTEADDYVVTASDRSILGHHDHIYDSITISKTLDSKDIPEWFVEYILYHEMLHIKHPARLINGRRYYHTSAFQARRAQISVLRAVAKVARASCTAAPSSAGACGVTLGTIQGRFAFL